VFGAQLDEGVVVDARRGHHHPRTHVVGTHKVDELLAPDIRQTVRRTQVAKKKKEKEKDSNLV
jgi:hypothetical protein